MNFKRFHESKNLLEDVITGVNIVANGSIVIDPKYNIWIAKVTAGETYRASNVNGTYGFYTEKPTTSSVTYNSSRELFSGDSPTIKVPQGVSYIGIRATSTANNVMLNTGSTPQPYEPYSSEVWHDIPYYQHKTATDTLTLPAVIYPNDTSITLGIKGNTTQSGTPTPQNPVDVLGTGDRTGNLAYKIIENANISADGLIATASGYNIMVAKVAQGQAYSGTGYVYAFFNDEPDVRSVSYNESRVVNNFKNATAPISGYVAVRYGSSENPMINEGSTALPYEPYGYKIPILLNSTTINKYLGTEQTVRQIKKYEFTGNETFYASSQTSVYYTTQISADCNKPVTYNTGCIVNAYKIRKQSTAANLLDGEFTTDTNGYLWFRNYDCATLDDFKTYLQQQYANGTPVTVWYVLATPTTDITNEPLMKIGTYADSLTTSIPCTAGENTLDVQTTVQPSEVTATFEGWHTGTVHERENGSWD